MEHEADTVTPPQARCSVGDAEADDAALECALRFARTGYPQRAYETALPVLCRARERASTRHLARSAQILSGVCGMMGRPEPGITYGREARSLFATMGDLAQAARSGANLAWLLATIGEQDAVREAQAALDSAETSADPTETIWALDSYAVALWLLKQLDQALPYAERAVELSRMHRPRLQRPLINLAGLRVELALRAGETGEALAKAVDAAVSLTSEALEFSRAVCDGWLERLALCNIAEYRLHLGDAAAAEWALNQVPATHGEMSDRCTYHYLHMLGRVRAAQGRRREAIELLRNCLQIAGRANDLETAAPCQKDLADLHAELGEFETALACHRAFHDLYVRQASHAAQRRARLCTLEWEAERLRASVRAAHQHAADLTASNRVLAQETERLLRASMEDPLTGLQNRRRLDLNFLDLIASGKSYAIAMIDVDRFKQVNDGFSHPVGDAVLRKVADLLQHNARAGDLTVRFGGDEFALLFHEADLPAAVAICERLRTGTLAQDWTRLHPELRVTLSIGVASSAEAKTQEGVLALADQRLYRAKQEGRNRVIAG
jgi:diguanylate cyclase (GGDEF)-like protein